MIVRLARVEWLHTLTGDRGWLCHRTDLWDDDGQGTDGAYQQICQGLSFRRIQLSIVDTMSI